MCSPNCQFPSTHVTNLNFELLVLKVAPLCHHEFRKLFLQVVHSGNWLRKKNGFPASDYKRCLSCVNLITGLLHRPRAVLNLSLSFKWRFFLFFLSKPHLLVKKLQNSCKVWGCVGAEEEKGARENEGEGNKMQFSVCVFVFGEEVESCIHCSNKEDLQTVQLSWSRGNLITSELSSPLRARFLYRPVNND